MAGEHEREGGEAPRAAGLGFWPVGNAGCWLVDLTVGLCTEHTNFAADLGRLNHVSRMLNVDVLGNF